MSTEPPHPARDRFAHVVFTIAWVWGMVSLVPLYFLEDYIGRKSGTPLSHPEYFFGFVGTALAFQLVFFLVSRQPARLRPLMLPSVAEKAAFAVPVFMLVAAGRAGADLLLFAGIDVVLGALFVVAYLKTAPDGFART